MTTPTPMPEALRLADEIDADPMVIGYDPAASLLRTQHERITALEADRAMLREALESFTKSEYIKKQHPKRYAAACAVLEKTK